MLSCSCRDVPPAVLFLLPHPRTLALPHWSPLSCILLFVLHLRAKPFSAPSPSTHRPGFPCTHRSHRGDVCVLAASVFLFSLKRPSMMPPSFLAPQDLLSSSPQWPPHRCAPPWSAGPLAHQLLLLSEPALPSCPSSLPVPVPHPLPVPLRPSPPEVAVPKLRPHFLLLFSFL